MAELKNFDWGYSTIESPSGDEFISGKRIYTKGTNTINPYVTIPLHVHDSDGEVYIPRTTGIHVLVIKAEDVPLYSSIKVMDEIAKLPAVPVGERVECPPGYAHALYNSFPLPGKVEFQKYRP